MVYTLLKNHILPTQNIMSSCRDDARKILQKLGVDYETIHACLNDCVLFRKEYAELEKFPTCGTNRYRKDLQGSTVPEKVLRHFPLIPRI